MILAVILLGIFQLFGAVFAYKLVENRIKTAINEQKTAITEELAKLVSGQPCQAASVVNAVSKTVGLEAGRSLRAGLMQSLGAASNTLNGITYEQTVEQIGEAQPGIGNLLTGLGRQKGSKLLKNPLLQLVFSALSNKGNSSQSSNVTQGKSKKGNFSL